MKRSERKRVRKEETRTSLNVVCGENCCKDVRDEHATDMALI